MAALDNQVAGFTRDSRDSHPSQDRQLEMTGVILKVVREFVLTRKDAAAHGERSPGQ